jgi:prolyl oligopeptidase
MHDDSGSIVNSRGKCHDGNSGGSQSGDDHGEQSPDPYRDLEDSSDPAAAAWAAVQNELTEAYLAAIPAREAIRSRLTELWDYPRLGVPAERGGRWFQTRNPGLRNQPVLYLMDDPGDEGRPLLDPNATSPDGSTAVAAIRISPDGSKVAYATSTSGSDWLSWRVRDTASGQDLGDALEWSKSAAAEWQQDSSGFYYVAMQAPRPGREYQDPSRAEQILFHRPGTVRQAPADGRLIPARPAVS